ncbi:MAG TPA: hypothetical protein VF040_06755 [Ktedonobacterales bacterium]
MGNIEHPAAAVRIVAGEFEDLVVGCLDPVVASEVEMVARDDCAG